MASQGWKAGLKNVRCSPRSTIVGLCVLALAAGRGVHFDPVGHLAMSAKDWFEVSCGVLTAVVSGLSQDATTGTAKNESPTAANREGSGNEVN